MLQALRHSVVRLLAVAAVAACAAHAARAQSPDVDYPTPVFTNELTGRIAPRDLGDARLTRHFYAFRATEGDLVITVESTYLYGSVDVFSLPALRPLAKVTLYGASSPTTVTRSVYLRREESLILRVEGRTMTDADAVYAVRFSGSFAPARADAVRTPPAPGPTPQAVASTRRGQRTATGARINEPAPEPTPTPAATETAENATPRADEPEASRPRADDERAAASSRRNTRQGGTRRGARTTPTTPRQSAPRRTTRDSRGGAARPTEPGADERREQVASAREARRREAAARDAARREAREREAREARERDDTASNESATAATPQPPGPRLVIVVKTGETIERDMTTVRRVTVERGQIVVVGTDGRVTRYPLASVQRMSIEP
ncbi:MAG TPA: hypothetical protein VER32_00010 [Pyrinomonadaceae bacterium]|nr:hypothetical protein [Pyrinomonadaceae bacterium]